MMILWIVGSHSLHQLTSSPYQRSIYLIRVLHRKMIKNHKHHNWIISHLTNYQMTCSYLFLNLPVFCNRWWPSYQIAQPLLSTTIAGTWDYWTCLFDPNFLAILSKFHGYELTFIIYSQTLDWLSNPSSFLHTHLSNLDTLLHLELCIRTTLTKSSQTNPSELLSLTSRDFTLVSQCSTLTWTLPWPNPTNPTK